MWVYVDDLLIAGTDMDIISNLKHVLNTKFSIQVLGNLKYFISFEVARSSKGMAILQRKYTLDILQEAGLLGAKPVPITMGPNHKL